MIVLLDTNVLVISVPPRSKYRSILDAFAERKYQLVITIEIYFEYIEKLDELSAKGVSKSIGNALQIARNIIESKVFYNWNLINTDPDDNKYIDAYIAANADYLITNDAHFNEVKKTSFPPVNIISADEFLEILKGL